MAQLTRLTSLPTAMVVMRDVKGREVVLVAVKGTFAWTSDGATTPAAEQRSIQDVDLYGGEPDRSGMLAASDISLPKPKVDVLVSGELVFGRPVESVDVAMDIGGRLRKVVRVSGERAWVMGQLGAAVPTRPTRVSRMPLVWERAFGGRDPHHQGAVDRANPVGLGFLGRAREPAIGSRLPNFEYPDYGQGNVTRSGPAGFGPVAPHWTPRAQLAGTYDDRWKETRFPLVPEDFDPRYLNVAPADQQLDLYRSDEEVRLLNMTPAGLERFRLPRFDCPIALIDSGFLVERRAVVDTVVIQPATRTLTVTARLVHQPRRDLLGVKQILVGPLSPGRRRALLTGKRYCERSSGRTLVAA